MSVISNLDTLQQNIENAKQILATNINSKGVSVTSADTLTQLANSVNNIEQGGSGGGNMFSDIGYDSTPQFILDDIAYSKTIYDSWNPSNTSFQLSYDKKIVYCPLVDTSNVTGMTSSFINCSNLQYVPSLNTSNVIGMNSMFSGCVNLKKIDLSSFDTSRVLDMYFMFKNCESLTSLDVSSFDTSKVNGMGSMFNYCKSLTSLDLSNFDTYKVTNMNNMFSYCESLTSLDVSSFDTSQVTNMGDMFSNCKSLTSLDLSNFDTSKVTRMNDMFYNCNKLTHIKCKQSFKDWCITNQDKISLPSTMREGGGGTWEIV